MHPGFFVVLKTGLPKKMIYDMYGSEPVLVLERLDYLTATSSSLIRSRYFAGRRTVLIARSSLTDLAIL